MATDVDNESSNKPEGLERPRSAALDDILGKPIEVLDDGFVRVVDYMGNDSSVVQAARVSYGAGTKKIHEDRGLIRYLLRHRHTTPFEMADIKLHVRVPMDAWRQWIRHRTACLAEGTEIYFDLPSGIERRGNQLDKIKIEDLWQRFQPTRNHSRPDKQRNPFFRRDRVRTMRLRQVNEDTLAIQRTSIVNVYKNGMKPVFRVTLESGKSIEATTGHRFFFANGWQTLKQATGLREQNGLAVWDSDSVCLYVNGRDVELPVHRDGEWLDEQYDARGRKVADIARISLTVARLERISRIEYAGEKMTYDLEVAGPYHNFIANGIVTHNSVNEYSTRYSIAIDAAQKTAPNEWRVQAKGNRQGSGGLLEAKDGAALTDKEHELHDLSRRYYDERLEAGVAREQARKDLPLSTYTEAYWKINLHNLLHFLSLRMDEHSQEEIRRYANVIGNEIVARWCPIVWEAFIDYRMNTLGLSRQEIAVVAALGGGDKQKAIDLATEFGWLKRGEKGLIRNRERNELEAKLERLNLPIPWRE